MTDVQNRILDAALAHVAFDGWTQATLERGAIDCGLPAEEALRAFPAGVADALDYFSARADNSMLDALRSDYALSEMRIRERIATCVMVRLRQNSLHREAVRRGLAHYQLPWNAPRGVKNLYATVDAMWKAAGDRSIDYNFYTKRLLLSKVYLSTLLVWLNDDSADLADTQDFLHRRIEDVMKIEKAKARAKEGLAKFEGFFKRA